MANTLKDLGSYAVTASFGTAYTVPALTKFVTGILHLVNTTNNTITIQFCKNGDTESNAILWNFPILANDFIEFGKGIIFSAGETIRIKASGTGVTFTGAGIEVT